MNKYEEHQVQRCSTTAKEWFKFHTSRILDQAARGLCKQYFTLSTMYAKEKIIYKRETFVDAFILLLHLTAYREHGRVIRHILNIYVYLVVLGGSGCSSTCKLFRSSSSFLSRNRFFGECGSIPGASMISEQF